jgi:hypothetical protein
VIDSTTDRNPQSSPDSKLTSHAAIARDALNGYTGSLAARGFVADGITLVESEVMDSFPIFHYLNKRDGMRIDISFSAAPPGQNGGFDVLIKNAVKRRFDVASHLESTGKSDEAKKFRYRSTDDVRAFIENFLQLLTSLFDTELKDVISGKKFVETPMDWGGYK